MSTIDQVTLLSREIEDRYSAKKKAGVVFIDLTAAYNTIWHCSLTCKFLHLLLDRLMVMELGQNCSFILTNGTRLPSRLCFLKNGITQGSVLAPLLFNIYIHDLPVTIARKICFADGLAILYSTSNWKTLEKILSQDMATISLYLQKWRQKLSTPKMMFAVFHFNNKKAQHKLSISVKSYHVEHTYLGIKLAYHKELSLHTLA